MFYTMINNARNKWFESDSCTVTSLVDYIIKKGQLRDAQIDAIRTYLFLKIKCESKSLASLFSAGMFNNVDINDFELSRQTRKYLEAHPAAAALLEYACLRNDTGEQVSEKLEKQIKREPESICYDRFFSDAFYGVSYTDYLFSLPMGAGKTYLMAAFIYLDLYFAINEPQNPAFAHNFIVFAPSGLKSSVIPSLKTIQNFDPSWILPEPVASDIKRMIYFEVLDQGKSANKSNKTRNPNVQKIANHQPLSELFGLVAVTNAEKVILDRIIEEEGLVKLLEDSGNEMDRQANELRSLIGQLPSLAVFIDEVHHAVSENIKLRAVVTNWADNESFNSVIGFSGTPYSESIRKLAVSDNLCVGTTEITNIVFYYPLIDGVGNFLKRPIVKIAELSDSVRIIENGVRAFLDAFKDTVYENGLTAKLAIYCGTIEKLESIVYPLVSRIASEYGLSVDAILRFHKGNKQYPQPAESQMQFDILDKNISTIRIVLLVQIGKEGWDCRSLTGIILSQEGDCPTTMVLQTSCRCLRQVVKGKPETALIYLNDSNAEKLNAQLKKQHHISLKEFAQANNNGTILKRYDRTVYLNLPKIDFYQLAIHYKTLIIEKPDAALEIPKAAEHAQIQSSIIRTTDLFMDTISMEFDETERGNVHATFYTWLYRICKGGFSTLTMGELQEHSAALQAVFDTITYEHDGSRFYSSKYDRFTVEANIRKAFCEKCSFTTKEELIPESANLLNIANFTPEVQTEKPQDYYPEQAIVKNIILDDRGELEISPDIITAIEILEKSNNAEMAQNLRKQYASHPQKDHSFHYLPYHTDSTFEQVFLSEVLALPEIEQLGLEVYYNGDRAMTEFKIKCYRSVGGKWSYIGMYTPDYLILKRKDGSIHKAIIVETKGEIYANDPTFKDKRSFIETEFIRKNNAMFGYERFEYLFLEDSLSTNDRIMAARDKISDFLGGV